MTAWEVQPQKQQYKVGEHILVRPAINNGLWTYPQYRSVLSATVVYVHPKGRFVVAEYELKAIFFGEKISTVRECFVTSKRSGK